MPRTNVASEERVMESLLGWAGSTVSPCVRRDNAANPRSLIPNVEGAGKPAPSSRGESSLRPFLLHLSLVAERLELGGADERPRAARGHVRVAVGREPRI